MTDVVVVCEGQTEETFVRDVLAPAGYSRQIWLSARLVDRQGGNLNHDRVIRFLRNTLRQRNDTFVATIFDLYRLKPAFPGVQDAAKAGGPLEQATRIEGALGSEVIQAAGCSSARFLPLIQPYEFEALLFADLPCLALVEPDWKPFIAPLQDSVSNASSPEHINDGEHTHPSARLVESLKPKYQKALHGPQAAAKIGLEKMTARCGHFAAWWARILNLPSSPQVPAVQA